MMRFRFFLIWTILACTFLMGGTPLEGG